MVNRGFYRSSPTVEMVTEAITKANEPLANSRQQPHLVVGSRVFLTPSGTVPIMFHLAMPGFLIKPVLSLLFNKNQSDESDKVELFPRYQPGGESTLEPLDPVAALRKIVVAEPVIPTLDLDRLNTLTRWVSSAPAFALTYAHLDQALALTERALAESGFPTAHAIG